MLFRSHARRFYGLALDPDANVVVTSGGTEALTASIMALAGRGGEVVLIEPAYDSYAPIAEAVGARIKSVKLAPPAWRLDADALAEAVTPETRALMLNTPLNPIGRAFTREELAGVVRAGVGGIELQQGVQGSLGFGELLFGEKSFGFCGQRVVISRMLAHPVLLRFGGSD